MIELYPEIRTTHITAVALSGALFFIRGLGLLFDRHWPRLAVVRYTSYFIDSVLLMAALMLMSVLHAYPFTHAWVAVKVLLLALYIVFGILAFRPCRTRAKRFLFWMSAMLIYGFIISVARAHHPLGVFLKMI